MDNKAFEEEEGETETSNKWNKKVKENERTDVQPYKKLSWHKRYKEAFKITSPVRNTKLGKEKTLPLNDVGCINYLTVGWISRTMWKAFRVGLVPTDVFETDKPDDAIRNAARFERLWEAEKKKCKEVNADRDKTLDQVKPSLTKVVWQFGKTRFLISLFLVTLSMFFQFVGPSILLNHLLEYLRDPAAPLETGIILLVLLFLSQLFRNITFNLQQSIGIHTALRLLSALEFLGYSKLLRLTSPSDAALGQLITFTTSDHDRIQEAVVMGVLFIGAPFTFIMSISYTLYLIGPSAIVGFVVILFLNPIMVKIGTLSSLLRLKVVAITDKRVAMMSEIINAMRLIKMYAWEQPFKQRIDKLRKDEIKQLRKAALLPSISSTISSAITIIAGFATFLTMTLAGVDLGTKEAFTVLSVLTSMQFCVGTLPLALKFVTEAHVGFTRLQELLELKDYNPSSSTGVPENPDTAIEFRGAGLAWEIMKEDKKNKKDKKKEKGKKGKLGDVEHTPCLFDLDLSISKGQLVGVAGGVGSGKTSLVSSVMGEMFLEHGALNVRGSVALVSQQTWIFNGTVRDNILMGSEFDSAWYQEVIEACELSSDLKLLNEGDQTIVGERGITLSGGQKQRVNLARALYANLDIYLLDDPLSAVDAKVGQQIFKKYIKTMLKNKTVVLVTHGMNYLNQCDLIFFLKDGKLVESGSPKILEGIENGHYANMADFDKNRDNTAANQEKKIRTVSVMALNEEEAAVQKTQTEEKSTPGSWATLLKYLNECGNKIIMTFAFLAITATATIRMFTSVWVKIWLDAGDGQEHVRAMNSSYQGVSDDQLKGLINDNPRLWFYQTIYGVIIVVMIVTGFFKGVILVMKLMGGSLTIHKKMLNSVMFSPMAFFDVTPSGRILNRFSKDLDIMDTKIPYYTENCIQYSLLLLSQIVLVCVLYPYFAVGFFFIAIGFGFMDQMMTRGVLESKKLDNLMKSPVLHHISSTMAGVTIIRGFGKEDVFKRRFNAYLNASNSADSMYRLASRWFMWRMDSLGLVTITLTAIVTVATKGSVTPAVAGLALSSIFQTCTYLPFIMKLKADFSAMLSSLDRIFEYVALTQEAPHIIESKRPPATWPHSGQLQINNVSFKYRPDLPLVLRNITMSIEGGKKVGIVGRTGAGKSSLISTLLRLVELESGEITIDGVDISQIGLADLRSAVAVIPQDPVLFQGTVRYNIDPFDTHTDQEVWRAIEESNLKEKVCAENKQLDMVVEAEGGNFSVGEKQLICLARALLRKNKILLLDEATASVDVKTDHLIQSTIQSAFSDCTVLTIAHRLNTIMGYHMVVVLDQGRVVEMDSPNNLLAAGGIFASMATAAGIRF